MGFLEVQNTEGKALCLLQGSSGPGTDPQTHFSGYIKGSV